MPDLSVIVVSFNTKALTLKCLKTIFDNKWQISFDVWVVDNNSQDGSVEAIKREFPQVKLIESKENLGFARGNNLALKRVKSRYALLLNSDTEVKKGALDQLVNFADKSGLGIASCKVLNKDGSLQPNHGQLPNPWSVFFWISGLDDILRKVFPVPSYQERAVNEYRGEREVGWVSGCALMVREDVAKKIGGLDEEIFMYAEDVEFCLRAKREGFKVGWTDKGEIVHLGGGSLTEPKFKQWAGEFKGLLYIYKKYYGGLAAMGLRFLIYLFIMVRMIAFLVTGRVSFSKTYGKVLTNI